nr:sigma factor-like helix-turn-helix DNA-binding protein [Sporobacter termitidis]
MTMLLDFYGDLLTDKQREYYDLYHNEDLSLSEIAENVGITRQGVHDIIVRAENTLLETERKTGLIKRFSEMQAEIARALILAEDIKRQTENEHTAAMAAQLAEVLTALKG